MSAWNAAGTTVEEKDYTKWCTEKLEKDLLGCASSQAEASSKVKKVSKCDGLANVCVIKGTARPGLDLHVSLDWEVELTDKTYKGSLDYPEVTIEGLRSSAIDKSRSFKKEVQAEHASEVDALLSSLEDDVAAKLEACVLELEAKC